MSSEPISYRFTPDESRALTELIWGEAKEKEARRLGLFLTIGVLLFAAEAANVWRLSARSGAWWSGLLLLGFGVVFVLIRRLTIAQRYAQRSFEDFHPGRERRLVATDEGLKLDIEGDEEMLLEWSLLVGTVTEGEWFVLRLKDGARIYVPLRAFASMERARAFGELIENRAGA